MYNVHCSLLPTQKQCGITMKYSSAAKERKNHKKMERNAANIDLQKMKIGKRRRRLEYSICNVLRRMAAKPRLIATKHTNTTEWCVSVCM